MTPPTSIASGPPATNAMGATTGHVQVGVVARFDVAQGLGEVTARDGTTYPFHCTAITDGSRDIAIGADVTFTVGFSHLGGIEASAVCPSGAPHERDLA